MDKQTVFMLAVQTASIVSDLKLDRYISATVLVFASRIPVDCLHESLLGTQANNFVNWYYLDGCSSTKKPSWLPPGFPHR